jgi:hypothetical protein
MSVTGDITFEVDDLDGKEIVFDVSWVDASSSGGGGDINDYSHAYDTFVEDGDDYYVDVVHGLGTVYKIMSVERKMSGAWYGGSVDRYEDTDINTRRLYFSSEPDGIRVYMIGKA